MMLHVEDRIVSPPRLLTLRCLGVLDGGIDVAETGDWVLA
jgi:hypothetical protein